LYLMVGVVFLLSLDSGDTTVATITALQPWMVYTFQVVSSNSFGASVPSQASDPVAPTPPQPWLPPPPVVIVSIVGLNSALQLSWLPGSAASDVGPVTGITVSIAHCHNIGCKHSSSSPSILTPPPRLLHRLFDHGIRCNKQLHSYKS
jgi:hypothetical protein